MTLGQFVEYLFGLGTGWLGWSPRQTWRATVPEIRIAVRALVQWHKLLNGQVEETPEQKAGKLKAFMDARVKSG